eukprot:snap_masked-scaffold_87-processed-gene-0.27-mRNA-1 protein AED:1.00 eAED:1.00 QI:0/0/0/0/1/1/2/0/83
MYLYYIMFHFFLLFQSVQLHFTILHYHVITNQKNSQNNPVQILEEKGKPTSHDLFKLFNNICFQRDNSLRIRHFSKCKGGVEN